MKVLAAAIEKARFDRKKIQEEMLKSDVPSVAYGKIKFDQTRRVISGPMTRLLVNGDKWALYAK